MTDEQWLWLYANWSLDNDEQLERMCPKCREEAMDTSKCTRCGKSLGHKHDTFVNPNFNKERFDELASE